MVRVAFIGLGAMGAPMASHLAAAGHAVTVYNRTRSKADMWVRRHDNAAAPTPAAAADGAALVMTCVGNDEDVRAVVLRDTGVLAGMTAGATLVDHTTTSAQLARELAVACAEHGCGFIDAPVSGGQAGAEQGRLTVMAGCDDPAVFEAARPVIEAYAAKCELLGPAGSGQLTKMVNQICIAGLVQALAEGVDFAMRAPASTSSTSSTSSARAPPRAGRWTTARRRWRPASSTSASPSSGCARTSGSASPRPPASVPASPSPRSSTSSTPRSSNAAAAGGTPAASCACCANRRHPVQSALVPGTNDAQQG